MSYNSISHIYTYPRLALDRISRTAMKRLEFQPTLLRASVQCQISTIKLQEIHTSTVHSFELHDIHQHSALVEWYTLVLSIAIPFIFWSCASFHMLFSPRLIFISLDFLLPLHSQVSVPSPLPYPAVPDFSKRPHLANLPVGVRPVNDDMPSADARYGQPIVSQSVGCMRSADGYHVHFGVLYG